MNARESMVERYKYLCGRGAARFARRRQDRADLEQIAAIGLIKAVDTYREEFQTPFEAYAWVMIQSELMHYVRDHERMVRAPRRLRELEREWHAAQEELALTFGREPFDDEIVRRLALDAQEMRDLHEYRERATITSIEELSPKLSLLASYTIESHDDKLMLESALARLTPLERKIFHATYDDNCTLLEISRKFGYSQRHISRLRSSSIQKLSSFLRRSHR